MLVERVEGFATEREWQRAYAEINQFEDQLVRHGTVLVKYWLHITRDEQLRRFKEREKTPHKRWKLTDEDWRNREKWDRYEAAVNDMICDGCGVCEPVCEYRAITIVGSDPRDPAKLKAVINEGLCMGCGTCVAACPSGALEQKGFKTAQILAQIDSALEGGAK